MCSCVVAEKSPTLTTQSLWLIFIVVSQAFLQLLLFKKELTYNLAPKKYI